MQRASSCLSTICQLINRDVHPCILSIYLPSLFPEMKITYVFNGLHAGFPTPAQDHAGETIDLAREMVRHPESTFYARISGNSMIEAGIHDGDIVVIDRSLEAQNGNYVAACIDGEFTIKEYQFDAKNQCAWLIPHNKDFQKIKVTADNQFCIWGVITYCVHKL